jgi:hypothetical protein
VTALILIVPPLGQGMERVAVIHGPAGHKKAASLFQGRPL